MKKILLPVLLPLALVGFLAASAGATAVNPKDRGVNFVGTDFIGIKKYILRAVAQTPVQITTASGLLYSICRVSPTYGDYALAWDYEAPGAGTLSSYILGVSKRYMEYLLSPYVYSEAPSTTVFEYIGYADSVRGCWKPAGGPSRFEAGLIGIHNSARGYTVYRYRLDDGTNP